MIDCGHTPSDVDRYILPALAELGIDTRRVQYLLLTHSHRDHAGGAEHLCYLLPWIRTRALEPVRLPNFEPLCDGDLLLGRLRVLHLPGHSRTSVGYFDEQSGTLLSGDCLQLAGVGKYVHGVQYADLYRNSVERLKSLPVERIVAAHEFVPLGSVAEGREMAAAYLDACLDLM